MASGDRRAGVAEQLLSHPDVMRVCVDLTAEPVSQLMGSSVYAHFV